MASIAESDSQSTLSQRAIKAVYPVSRLVREARALLESSFTLLWVEGEISNLAMPGSGHIYFTLKDNAAQVRCAMFKNRNQYLQFTPENGMQVLLRVKVTLYEGRGEFQLVVEHMEEAGSGALQRAYEALKARLGREGLFDTELKKPLPALPGTIGIISSPDGAAVHDILSVLKRRFPSIPVILYPVAVQGETAAKQLKQAVEMAGKRQECDVLIIGRGGGSLEDLWSFNDEALARAIVACPIPIVSAVGHEIDFSIADFVADVRAATPSAAAELVVPEARQLSQALTQCLQQIQQKVFYQLQQAQRHVRYLQQRLPKPLNALRAHQQYLTRLDQQLQATLRQRLQSQQQRFDYLTLRLKHPEERLNLYQQRLQQIMQRLQQAVTRQYTARQHDTQALHKRLLRQLPHKRLQQAQRTVQSAEQQLYKLMALQLQQQRSRLSQAARTLSAVSPLNTLDRGYSISREPETGKVLQTTQQVQIGQQIEVRLRHALLACEIKQIKPVD